jgi:putative DNA primase/helicase
MTDQNIHAFLESIPDLGASITVPNAPDMPDGYAMFQDGIYYLPDGDTADLVPVCSPLRVDAKFRLEGNTGWGILLSVRAPDGTWHDVPVSRRLLAVKPTEVLGILIDHGLELAPHAKSKDHLFSLLRSWKPSLLMVAVPHGGWSDASCTSFILGSRVMGSGQVVPLAVGKGPGRAIGVVNTADAWRDALGTKCQGNPLMILAVSLAFSGPLLEPLGMSGGGLHFRGASSSGKTTLLNLAASVWGGPGLISTWHSTANGLEAVAPMLNGLLLPLDEIAEISARDLSGAIYMLANGTGKNRMKKDITLADPARWRVSVISSGEISIAEKLREAHVDVMAGHEVRLIDVEADARLYGAFDELHGALDGAEFANSLLKACHSHHGAVGAKFVEHLVQTLAAGKGVSMQTLAGTLTARWLRKLPAAPDGQTERVAARFALIATAGVLATKFGLTGWKLNEATDAAEVAFVEWYDRRFEAKRDAVEKFITPLREFLAASLSSLQEVGTPATSSLVPVGWRDATRVYLPIATWATIYPGAEATAAAKALIAMGILLGGEDDRTTRKAPRLIPGRPRLYTINLPKLTAYRSE